MTSPDADPFESHGCLQRVDERRGSALPPGTIQ
jgi:hypothetical protein